MVSTVEGTIVYTLCCLILLVVLHIKFGGGE